MSWVPDEQRSYRGLFFCLSLALAFVSLWAVYDEAITRRPWKTWQARWLAHTDDAGPQVITQLNLPNIGALDRCTTCHAGIDDPLGDDETLPAALRRHPRHEELLGTHPPETFGCTSCHHGQGVALTAEDAHADPGSYWPDPMLRGAYVESGCLACHAEEPELAGAPTLSLGRRVFEEKGCSGCHATTDERPEPRGPSLRHIGSKLHPGALAAWIQDPQARRAGHEMPSFWPDDTDRGATESVAIAAWLLSVSEPFPADAPVSEADPALATAGAVIFDEVGCRGCHVLGGPGQDDLVLGKADEAPSDDAWAAFGDGFGGGDEAPAPDAPPPIDFGPPLGQIGARVQHGFLVGWLQDPASYDPSASMPSLRLTQDEAAAIAAFLAGLGGAPLPSPAALVPPWDPALLEQGRGLVSTYGCYGCHDIPGFENAGRPGPDLADYGRKERRELYFGDADVPLEQQDWLRYTTTKLQDPRAFATDDVQSVMPLFDLDPAERDGLAVYLRGLGSEPPPTGLAHPPTRSAQLRLADRIIEERNCRGCHTFADRDGDIGRYYADVNHGPPNLSSEGRRVRPGWLFNYLVSPVDLRPWLAIRMPRFRFTEDEAAALTAWFSDQAGVTAPFRPIPHQPITADRAAQGAWLFGELKCVTCHQLGGGSAVDSGDLAPDLGLARQRLDPAWVRTFLVDPAVDLPGTRMPQFFAGGRSAWPELLDGDADAQIDLLVDHLMNLGLQPQGAPPTEDGS